MPVLTAGTTSSSVAIGTIGNDFQVYVYNDGPADAHVVQGATPTALLTSPRVIAGCFLPMSATTGQSVAAITAAGTAALRITSPGVGIIG